MNRPQPPIGKTHDAIAVAGRLLDALHAEHEALLHNDADALTRAVAEKQALLHELAPLGNAPADDTELRRLLARCQRQNQINGGIVAARLRHTERSLAILRGQPDAGLYGPRGAAAENDPVRRSLARA